MKYSFKITIEVPDDRFEGPCPSKSDVAKFLREEAVFAGGQSYCGDENTPPDWQYVLYRYGVVSVLGIATGDK